MTTGSIRAARHMPEGRGWAADPGLPADRGPLAGRHGHSAVRRRWNDALEPGNTRLRETMEPRNAYPTGTVAFLFTDIEGSTVRWEQDRPAMMAVVERHLALLRRAVEAHRGVLFKVIGDAVQAAFPTAPDAVSAALDAQRALVRTDWGALAPLQVCMAVHVGAAQPHAGDYLASALNRLARLLASGSGGQVLLTMAAADLARDDLPAGASLRDLGEHRL